MLLQTYRYGSYVLYYNPKYFWPLLLCRILFYNWLIGIQLICQYLVFLILFLKLILNHIEIMV